jgi:hypothetical protein
MAEGASVCANDAKCPYVPSLVAAGYFTNFFSVPFYTVRYWSN